MVSNWLPHTPVQKKICLVLEHKTVWCSLSSSSIQIGVLAGTFYITLISSLFLSSLQICWWCFYGDHSLDNLQARTRP